jgi:glutamate-1-semialdehyde aminotransferase
VKSCAELVTELYEEVLWREPDPQGLDGYAAKLESGELLPDRLREILLNSNEYKTVVQQRARSFVEAGRQFQRQAPWKLFPSQSAIKVECAKFRGGPWYVAVAGQDAAPGLMLCESLSMLRRRAEGGALTDGDDRLATVTTVTFPNDPKTGLGGLEEGKQSGNSSASGDAFPEIVHQERGLSRRPPAWEMELLESCLHAIPEFLSRNRPLPQLLAEQQPVLDEGAIAQDHTISERLTAPALSGESVLCLRWVNHNEGKASADYGAAIHHNVPVKLPADELRTCWVTAENRGTKTWRRHATEAPRLTHTDRPERAVQLVIDLDGIRSARLELPHDVPPGERASLHWTFRTPGAAGRHVLKIELVEQDGFTFDQRGVTPVWIIFDTFSGPASATSRMRDRALASVARLWMPSESISWSTSGAGYPMFAKEAKGYHITDVDCRRFTDLLMGWGASLLGYANERIQRAIAGALGSGAVVSLTHELEIEVGEMLCKAFPGAEMVLFGKNGSDLCSAAVRLARLHTRRPIILVCGYHGFQDWYAERYGFAGTGVPERERPYIFPFQLNNLEGVARLFGEHQGQVAAVMLEPAGPFEDHNGPVPDADAAFLRELVGLAHKEGAVVIFDEIMCGFRYPTGSVQRATGVVPDLTCLGKGLSAGMPLSALVGRREVFSSSIAHIFYGPTFRGEAYSLAAAREALNVYQERDVPARITSFGMRLKQAANQIFQKLHAPAAMIGPPFRMVISYKETNRRRLTLMRTLVQQELYKQGILTCMNLFVPCDAHDDRALADACRGLEHAMTVLMQAIEDDCFARYLEIPPILT